MSLGSILLAIWLILLGLVWTAVITISTKFLGIWAIVTGAILLIEGYHPIVLPVRRPPAA